MNTTTPRTDAATHDDWSGGEPATEPEVARQLETELAEALAANLQLREVLVNILPEWHADDNGTKANGEVSGEISYGDIRQIKKALTQPAPPVVPIEDVKPLLEALRQISREAFTPMSKRLHTDAGIAEQALTTFTTKHPAP